MLCTGDEFMTHRRYLTPTILVLLCGVIAYFVYWFVIRESTESLLKRAELQFRLANFERAEQIAHEVLARDPGEDQALYLTGQLTSRSGRDLEAVSYFDRVSDHFPNAAEARFRAGEILALRLFQPTPAEKCLRHALRLDPQHDQAQQYLSALLALCGDNQEATRLRFERVQQGKFSDMDLIILALGETVDDAALREKMCHASRDDPLAWQIQAITAIQNRDFTTADKLLRRVLSRRNDVLVADAQLGRILLDRGNQHQFGEWLQQLPPEADHRHDVWLVRGDWARQQGDIRGAARCYAESLRIAPASQRANYLLSQVLSTLGELKLAETFATRAHLLNDLTIAAQSYLKAASPIAVKRLFEIARSCDLTWDAWGWSQVAQAMTSKNKSVPKLERPKTGSPRIPDHVRELQRLLAKYPLPQFSRKIPIEDPTNQNRHVPVESAARILFNNDAKSSGLSFQYVPGDQPGEVGLRMFQFSGGGVAVLDFDQDGWPDLYFPQGHLWPMEEEDRAPDMVTRDRFFRNVGNGHFEDITSSAALTGRGYGQGVTIGDLNSDGFPDIYVATLAENRLYLNNGDGTYKDVTAESGTAGNRWTTSCLMADLNGDGLPDIYAVNYLEAPDLRTRICRNHRGKHRRCSPFELDAAQDQLYLNLGDGRFEEVTSESGIATAGGKGLGIVAADFDGSGRLSLFVANDMMPNFFFENVTESPGARPQFVESALPSGVAYDRDGRVQGCMGIAIGDTRGNGLLNLFVTNYYLESNTLYEQKTRGIFEDVTQQVGLREPSLKMLGFGTQFLDAELDGWPDLIVANGHVDDETEQGVPFHMHPQVFRNSGAGQFLELSAESLGPWFAGKYLGRGLARIDWNRDGREDFVVTNLDTPVALLTNNTVDSGNSIRLQLRGVQCNRDAIGTTVRIQVQGQERMQQLTAGDGYESSNQRQLILGIGPAQSAEIMTIRWPGGATQQFTDVRACQEYLAIEGHPRLVKLPSTTLNWDQGSQR